ncbi:MAG: CvpA family protein [Proteobacteria bacterium]|nr:CvpA family protein [Pseudomonadota bacterium]
MNGLDIAFIAILFFFFVRGIFRGFIKELTSTFGLVAGYVISRQYYPETAELLKPFVQDQNYRLAIGFLMLCLGLFLAISLLGLVLDRVLKVTLGNVTNGLLGAAVGLLKAVALSAIVLMVATAFIRPETPFFQDSLAWPYIRYISNSLREMLPQNLKDVLDKKPSLLPEQIKDKLPDLPALPKPDSNAPADWKPIQPDQSGGKTAPAWPGSDSNRK